MSTITGWLKCEGTKILANYTALTQCRTDQSSTKNSTTNQVVQQHSVKRIPSARYTKIGTVSLPPHFFSVPKPVFSISISLS